MGYVFSCSSFFGWDGWAFSQVLFWPVKILHIIVFIEGLAYTINKLIMRKTIREYTSLMGKIKPITLGIACVGPCASGLQTGTDGYGAGGGWVAWLHGCASLRKNNKQIVPAGRDGSVTAAPYFEVF
jgi:hypothetical protein